MSKFTFLMLFVCIAGSTYCQDKTSVLFDSDSHRLTPFQTEKIDVLLQQAEGGQCSISLSGHTDSDASDDYNIALSERRVSVVSDYIQARHPKLAIEKTAFFGEDRPIANNSNIETKSLNRRVEITLSCTSDKSNKEVLQSVWPSLEALAPSPKSFQFDGPAGGTFDLSNGAKIYVAPNQLKGRINLDVYECTDKKAALAYGLTTQSNRTGEGLISAGMYRIRFTRRGRLVPNLTSNDVKIFVPVDRDDFKTFVSVPNGPYTEWDLENGQTRENNRDDLFVPWAAMGAICGGVWGEYRCRFFWCGIRSFFSPRRRKSTKTERVASVMRSSQYDNFYELYGENLKPTFNSKRELANFIAKNRPDEVLAKLAELVPNIQDQAFHILNMPSYSWVNCDRFSGRRNLTNLTVSAALDANADARLYFDKEFCVMAAQKVDKKKIRFDRIPLGEAVTLVIIKKVNHVLMMSRSSFKVGENPSIDFKPIKSKELEEAI